MPSFTFTQNVDQISQLSTYFENSVELFPEYQQMFYFEINEEITEDY
ncbi:MAG: hypothetical protein Ct9H300mP28_37340 [Pseudomonadota bacterium]|nr:MAG: hypothetical protein Ct9H300mP28_37340 [Pseudomonadota bacterium]